MRLIEPDAPEDQLEARHNSLVDSGRIIWVTFHPSYSYEDFVEGFRPVTQEHGLTYVPKPGPLRLACSRCTDELPADAYFEVGQPLEATAGNEYTVVHCDASGLLLKKTKGKGEGLESPVSLRVIERLFQHGFRSGDMSVSGKDYERKTEISRKTGIDAQSLFGMTGPIRAVMASLEEKGYRSPTTPRPVVMVIDEINRADLSRVFGELITLLEVDKRLGRREQKLVTLPYSQDVFGLPAELHLIGTMNTADRSLSLIDHALRRRFEFEEVPPEPEVCPTDWGGVDVAALLRAWNRRITALLTREQQLGHAYLMELRLEATQTQFRFSDDADGRLRALAMTIRRTILPMLIEYFHDDWRKVDFVFGRDYSRGTGGLLTHISLTDLQEPAGDVADLTDAGTFEPAEFWDASRVAWDPERFKQRLQDVIRQTS